MKLFEEAQKELKGKLFTDKPLIVNPTNFSNFKSQTPLYEEPLKLKLSL